MQENLLLAARALVEVLENYAYSPEELAGLEPVLFAMHLLYHDIVTPHPEVILFLLAGDRENWDAMAKAGDFS